MHTLPTSDILSSSNCSASLSPGHLIFIYLMWNTECLFFWSLEMCTFLYHWLKKEGGSICLSGRLWTAFLNYLCYSGCVKDQGTDHAGCCGFFPLSFVATALCKSSKSEGVYESDGRQAGRQTDCRTGWLAGWLSLLDNSVARTRWGNVRILSVSSSVCAYHLSTWTYCWHLSEYLLWLPGS